MSLLHLRTQITRYLKRGTSVSFWHTPIAPVFYDFASLSDYYIDFSAKTLYAGPFDAQGIPILDYCGAIGRQYNPCAVAQYALGWYRRWRCGDNAARFLQMADWLERELVPDDEGGGRWLYRFDLDAYGVRKPWTSALSQAQGVSVLLRAAQITNGEHYLRAAERACRTLLAPVAEGGLKRVTDEGTFLEEVVADRLTAILDGLMFAVFGLQDYCFVTNDAAARRVLQDCYDTLERILPKYDLGYWSRADLYQHQPPMLASEFYHGLHVAQLQVLSQLTGRPIFNEYAEEFAKQARSGWNRWRARINKTWFKLRHY